MSNRHGCCADKACNSSTCMELPADKTCGDCAHLPRCVAFGVTHAARTSCDWFPRRFREPVAKPITSVAEFCAEADRIGLTAAGLAEALRDQPEFADCAPSAGVCARCGGAGTVVTWGGGEQRPCPTCGVQTTAARPPRLRVSELPGELRLPGHCWRGGPL